MCLLKAQPQDRRLPWKQVKRFARQQQTEVPRMPRGCPRPGRLLGTGTLHRARALFREIRQNSLLIILSRANIFKALKNETSYY